MTLLERDNEYERALIWEAQPESDRVPDEATFRSSPTETVFLRIEDLESATVLMTPDISALKDDAQPASTGPGIDVRSLLDIGGIILVALAAGHFAAEGRIVYIIPAFIAALYFLLDMAGRWEERRRHAVGVSVSSYAANSRYGAGGFLAGISNYLR